MTEWYERTQGATLVTADHHGEAWTPEQIDIVNEFTDEVTDEELATTLGRSLTAVWAIQHRIKQDGYDVTRARSVKPAPRPSERAYTFIGDDVPPGWD